MLRRDWWCWALVLVVIGGCVSVLWNAPALPAERCIASWYPPTGHRTADGERYNPNAFTAAHRSIAFGAMIGVRRGNRKITVRVNDRGPFVKGRCLDVSPAAARALGFKGQGTAIVTIERVK